MRIRIARIFQNCRGRAPGTHYSCMKLIFMPLLSFKCFHKFFYILGTRHVAYQQGIISFNNDQILSTNTRHELFAAEDQAVLRFMGNNVAPYDITLFVFL